jgi:hypothetical protein
MLFPATILFRAFKAVGIDMSSYPVSCAPFLMLINTRSSMIRQAGEFAADDACAMISSSAGMFTPNNGALMNIFMSLALTIALEYGQMVHMKMKLVMMS